MDLADDRRVGERGVGTPSVAAHRRTPALDVGSGAAVDDDDAAGGELAGNVFVHQVPRDAHSFTCFARMIRTGPRRPDG
jgi:hypothetical protein